MPVEDQNNLPRDRHHPPANSSKKDNPGNSRETPPSAPSPTDADEWWQWAVDLPATDANDED